MDALFKALADPARRAIVEMVAETERPAGEIAEIIGARFSMTRPAVSQHLKVLERAGVIDVRRVGPRRLSRLKPDALTPAREWFADFPPVRA